MSGILELPPELSKLNDVGAASNTNDRLNTSEVKQNSINPATYGLKVRSDEYATHTYPYINQAKICNLYIGPNNVDWKEYDGGKNWPKIHQAVFLTADQSTLESAFKYKMSYNLKSFTETSFGKLMTKAGNIAGSVANVIDQAKSVSSGEQDLQQGLVNAAANPQLIMENDPIFSAGSETSKLFDGLKITFNFAFGKYGLWDSYREVVMPTLKLSLMFSLNVLADAGDVGLFSNIYPNGTQAGISAIGSLISSNSDSDSSTAGSSGNGEATQALVDLYSKLITTTESVYKNSNWRYCTLQLANLEIPNLAVSNLESTFNYKKTDEYGFPMESSVTLTFKSPHAATPSKLVQFLTHGTTMESNGSIPSEITDISNK